MMAATVKEREVWVPEDAEARGMKGAAIRYFHRQAEQYAERYLVRAAGDVLWDRHKAILKLLHKTGLPAGSKIIDLGCGPGFLSRDLARRGYRGVGLDAAEAMVECSRAHAEAAGIAQLWQYGVGDVEAIPFERGLFDAAVCAGVIEYVPDDERFLSEVARVLKPGGRFILCVTNKFGYTVSLYPLLHALKRVPGFVRLASLSRKLLVGGNHGAMDFGFLPRKHRPSEIRRLLTRSGFRFEEDRYTQFTLLPSPFCAVLSKLRLSFEEQLDALNRTPLRGIGSCYIVSTRKEN
jgi:ubiquinone/menaquinone biosynthesis C-methylase UbiE